MAELRKQWGSGDLGTPNFTWPFLAVNCFLVFSEGFTKSSERSIYAQMVSWGALCGSQPSMKWQSNEAVKVRFIRFKNILAEMIVWSAVRGLPLIIPEIAITPVGFRF